jgi:hypothetical protein
MCKKLLLSPPIKETKGKKHSKNPLEKASSVKRHNDSSCKGILLVSLPIHAGLLHLASSSSSAAAARQYKHSRHGNV